jgi:predicted transcriptional regulator
MSNSVKTKQVSLQEKVSTFNSKSRPGDQKRISEMTGYSASYVSEVLSGKYQNKSIVDYAYKITRARK